MEYIKVKLTPDAVILGGAKSKRTVYLRVEKAPKAGESVYGYEVNPKTLVEVGCTDKVTTKRMIHSSAIAGITMMYEDLRYGELTTLTFAEQKARRNS